MNFKTFSLLVENYLVIEVKMVNLDSSFHLKKTLTYKCSNLELWFDGTKEWDNPNTSSKDKASLLVLACIIC